MGKQTAEIEQQSAHHAGRKHYRIIALWILCLLCSLACIGFLPQKVLTESTGARHSEAFRVMQRLQDEFDLPMANTLALLTIGKQPAPGLWLQLQREFPEIQNINPAPGFNRPGQELYFLSLNPQFEFVKGPELIKPLRSRLHSVGQQSGFKSYLSGNLAFYADIVAESESYFSVNELIVLALAFVVLLWSFGGVLAAFLPVLMGLSSLFMFQGFLRISQLETTTMSATLNSLLGLALAIDYCLFWISRFREERQSESILGQAIQKTADSAGRTIWISALIIFTSIAVLFIPDISGLRIMALNLMGVIAFCLLHVRLFLPAWVQLLDRRLDWPQVLTQRFHSSQGQVKWQSYARHITAYPRRYFALSLFLMVALCAPVVTMKLWDPVQTLASDQSESMQAYHQLAKGPFGGQMVPIFVLMQAPAGSSIQAPGALHDIYAFSQYLKSQPQISGVSSLMSWQADFKEADYLSFYQQMQFLQGLSQAFGAQASTSPWINARGDTHLITVFAKDIMQVKSMHQISDLIRQYARQHPEYQITTSSVIERARDFSHEMYRHTPTMVALVLVGIFMILWLHLKVVVLPLKAGLMNFVPILGAFGILTMIYQYGWGSQILKTPVHGAVSSMIPMTLFCVLFGLSMDYEVLILSRINEAYQKGLNVREAIVQGMAQSGSVISSATLIFLLMFLPAALSPAPAIRELGIGIVVALILDATVLRLLWVPSFMMLMGEWNWWKPFQHKLPDAPADP